MFNNNRPVSLLCVISKVLESIMNPRLIEHLENCRVLMNNQFGFRKLHSSYMTLMVLMNNLISSLENGETVVGVFLDFSKAFDTVDHDILLAKLEQHGIRGNALVWFRSYLTDREQFVTYNGVASSTKPISCGVPQGSILGPLLFLVYINDLCNVCKSTLPVLFANDTYLFKSSQDISIIENVLIEELKNISLWLKVNKLSLNVKKTHFIVFTKRKKCNEPIKLFIDNQTIDEVRSITFLGVIIDKKITWKDHINYVAGKVSRAIGMMVKANKYIRKEALLTLYFSFVYPYLTYFNHIWGATYISNLKNSLTYTIGLWGLFPMLNIEKMQTLSTKHWESWNWLILTNTWLVALWSNTAMAVCLNCLIYSLYTIVTTTIIIHTLHNTFIFYQSKQI